LRNYRTNLQLRHVSAVLERQSGRREHRSAGQGDYTSDKQLSLSACFNGPEMGGLTDG